MYKTGSLTTATTQTTTTTPKNCYLGKMAPMKVSWLLKQREHEFNVKIRSLSVCPTLSLSASVEPLTKYDQDDNERVLASLQRFTAGPNRLTY